MIFLGRGKGIRLARPPGNRQPEGLGYQGVQPAVMQIGFIEVWVGGTLPVDSQIIQDAPSPGVGPAIPGFHIEMETADGDGRGLARVIVAITEPGFGEQGREFPSGGGVRSNRAVDRCGYWLERPGETASNHYQAAS